MVDHPLIHPTSAESHTWPIIRARSDMSGMSGSPIALEMIRASPGLAAVGGLRYPGVLRHVVGRAGAVRTEAEGLAVAKGLEAQQQAVGKDQTALINAIRALADGTQRFMPENLALTVGDVHEQVSVDAHSDPLDTSNASHFTFI